MNGSGEPPQDWERVRRGGRFVFHVVVTLATVVVCVLGEALGSVAFRGGDGLGRQVVSAALFGFVAGNLLALWLWARQDARR